MITENLSTLKIHKLTQEQYDRELKAGNIDENALYLTPEENIDLSGYATIEEMNDKADKEHNHDDIYYTETEIDQKLSDVNISITNITSGSTSVKEAEHAGNADTATKLTTSAGSATKPVYFSDGKPVACTYELKKTVPSDAVFTDTKYTHPTSSGNKHIPSGGSSGQILRWSADGTAVWGNDNNTTYSNATTETNGLMSSSDKTKLNGIASGANKYTHPSYTARTGVPTGNQAPGFGGTFTVTQPVSDGTGHITAMNSRTITIPNAVATTSANGLMSASDKTKLDSVTAPVPITQADYDALGSTATTDNNLYLVN